MTTLLFLAAVACFVIAILVVCVPLSIGPWAAWMAGGLLAWILLEHAGGVLGRLTVAPARSESRSPTP